MFLPGSGNSVVDRFEREQAREEPDDYCTDCKSSPCQCDELYERSRYDE
jgi:hypothetical protein